MSGLTEQLSWRGVDDSRRMGEEEGDDETGSLSYTISDHGTMLSIEVHRPPGGDMMVDSCLLTHPTAFALHYCKRKVLQPYFKLLALLGWRPWLPQVEDQALWLRLINIIYPLMVLMLLVAGYTIQFLARFRRDRAMVEYGPPLQASSSNLTTSHPDLTSPRPHLTSHQDAPNLISLYLIPDLLHLAAYLYIFFLFRIMKTENLQTLMEKVFLQSSVTSYSGFCSQKKLIRKLRLFLLLAGIWLILSTLTHLLHLFSQPIYFYGVEGDHHLLSPTLPTSTSHNITHYVLLAVMVLGLLALDCIYIAIVMSYSTQCQLILSLLCSLCERIRERSISIMSAMKEISECKQMIDFLNHHTGAALSLLMFNFITMVILGISASLDGTLNLSNLMYVSTLLIVCLWALLVLIPLVQAIRVSSACHSVYCLGHEVRIRPFGYQDLPPADLDSFLLYTSTINMKAKLFCLPVRGSCLCGLISVVTLVVLVVCQMDLVHI